MKKTTTISVIGMGYIGLPTAATFANVGYTVAGVDIRSEIIEAINSGEIHINEQGLDILVRAAVQRGNLCASVRPKMADIHIIAVPTPIQSDKKPDLSYVKSATRTISEVLKPGNLVIIESTVPPRTCTDLIGPLIEEKTGLKHESDYHLAHCPERVIPGKILHEIIYNDRIIGGTTPEATKRTSELYSSFVKGQLLETDATTAEMCKLMENTFRDVNIALANEFSRISEDIGINVKEAIYLANRHPRVNIHNPGIGVGGHCISIDPWFIVHTSPEKAKLIRCAREINDGRPKQIVHSILKILHNAPKKHIAFFGLSYKPNVDDLRESPAVKIVEMITQSATIQVDDIYVVEPNIKNLPKVFSCLEKVKLINAQEAITKAQIIFVLVKHDQFKEIVDWGGAQTFDFSGVNQPTMNKKLR